MPVTKFLDPKNDSAFKRIFGTEKNKDILIHFINDVLKLKGSDKIKEVTFLPPMQEPEIVSRKQSIVDILCKDNKGRQLIIEMQVSPQKGFEKRAQYYASKAYISQMNVGGKYYNLKGVIFIAICDTTVFKKKKSYISYHNFQDEETHEKDLKDLSFVFIELSKFPHKHIEELKTIIEKWCFFFKDTPEVDEEEIKKLIGTEAILGRAYEELNKYNWTEEELRVYEEDQKRMMDNKANEDYFLDLGMEQGLEKGRVEGREEGLEEGRVEGEQQKALEIAKNMVQQGFETSVIQQLTGLSKEEIERL